MAETQNVKFEDGGIWEYQKQRGLNRKFPMNGVPKVQKRKLSSTEQELLINPMIKNASKKKMHTA